MVGKMCAAHNRFFTRRHKGAKNKDLLFLRFYNCEPFEEGPGQIADVTNAFLLNTVLVGFLGYFLPLYIYLVLSFTKCCWRPKLVRSFIAKKQALDARLWRDSHALNVKKRLAKIRIGKM